MKREEPHRKAVRLLPFGGAQRVRLAHVWWRRWESNQFPPFYREKKRNFQAENVALLWAEILHIEPHPVP